MNKSNFAYLAAYMTSVFPVNIQITLYTVSANISPPGFAKVAIFWINKV